MATQRKVSKFLALFAIILLANFASTENLTVDSTGQAPLGEATKPDSTGQDQSLETLDSSQNKVLTQTIAPVQTPPTEISEPTVTKPDPIPEPEQVQPKSESEPEQDPTQSGGKILDYYAGEIELEKASVHTKIHYKLRRRSLELQFEGRYFKLKDKLIIQFRKNDLDENKMGNDQSEECPSLAYWFRKDLVGHVAWTLAAACREGEPAVTPVFGLAGDWIREEDGVVNSESSGEQVWRFRGTRNFEEEDLTPYGFDDYKFVRIYIVGKNQNGSMEGGNEIFEIKPFYKSE